MVEVTSDQPLTLAGSSTSLTCTATVIDYLVVDPDLQWLDTDGSVIASTSTSDLAVMETAQSGLDFIRRVEFRTLRTSHGGQYRCRTTIRINEDVQAQAEATTDVRVQSKWHDMCII